MIISKHLGSTLKMAEKLNYEGLTDISDIKFMQTCEKNIADLLQCTWKIVHPVHTEIHKNKLARVENSI